jgi:chemotaxis protein methyltransferase CheR
MDTAADPARAPFRSIFAPVPDLDEAAYERMALQVRSLLGIDLSQYKPAQVWRRVHGFASARGLPDVASLLERSRTDPTLRQAFMDMLTINVSEFFRNPEAWEMLATSILRPMLTAQVAVRIWSAGCSLGYEPFSLAMICREIAPKTPVKILATDLDETTLGKARAGIYNEGQMAGVSAARRARFWHVDGANWEAGLDLRSMITWKRHDLLRDPHDRGFDLICCRNVVIYFTETAKAQLYTNFLGALRPGGTLFLGATEAITNVRASGFVPAGLTFYQRPAA